MLGYSDIKPKKIIELDGEPYQVLSAHVFRKQQRKPVNQTKLKHLTTGKVVEYTFHQSESVTEADVSKKNIIYLFRKPNRQRGVMEFWFSNPNNPSERFMLDENVLGDTQLFLKEQQPVEALTFNENIIGISLPIKLVLAVTDAPPNVRGSTAQSGTKQVTLETGVVVATPMFIEEGDQIEINTETGQYVRRTE